MQRVIVIGCSGSGKSTLARIIGDTVGLPVYHLDSLYWQPGWKPHPDEDQFQRTIREIVQTDRWIIDGGFTKASGVERFSRADTLVLFDLPRWKCLFRALKRLATYRGSARPDLAPGCPERFDPEFYRYIWNYQRNNLPKILGYVQNHFNGRLVCIRSQATRTSFVESLHRSR
jgi:adenylate kinase family enzyme